MQNTLNSKRPISLCSVPAHLDIKVNKMAHELAKMEPEMNPNEATITALSLAKIRGRVVKAIGN